MEEAGVEVEGGNGRYIVSRVSIQRYHGSRKRYQLNSHVTLIEPIIIQKYSHLLVDWILIGYYRRMWEIVFQCIADIYHVPDQCLAQYAQYNAQLLSFQAFRMSRAIE